MSNIQDYEAKIGVITAIPTKEAKSPNMPVDVYVQEAVDVIDVASDNKAEFKKTGLDMPFLKDALVRCGALREAESRWMTMFNVEADAQKVWLEKSPKAYFMRDDLLDVQRYAFRKNDDLLKNVRNIAKGRGHSDMLQDLNDIAALAKKNEKYFTPINFDMAGFEEAADLAASMSLILADAHSEENINKARLIRDKAYTHLKEVVDEIRDAGKFIFRYEPEILEKFSSDYIRKLNKEYRSKPEETEQVQITE